MRYSRHCREAIHDMAPAAHRRPTANVPGHMMSRAGQSARQKTVAGSVHTGAHGVEAPAEWRASIQTKPERKAAIR